MRFSAITALCAAPLALAGNLHADLVARGAVDLEVRDKDMMMDNGNDSMGSKGDDMGANMGSKGGSSDHSEQIVSVQDIIVVWFNNGGGAATSTVADTATVAAGGSKATHSVSLPLRLCEATDPDSQTGYRWWLSWTRLHAGHDRSSCWRHGHFYILGAEPYRHTICLHHSLREARRR